MADELTALTTGAAQMLALNQIGAYSEDQNYTDDQVGIVRGRLPQGPVQAIGLTPYVVQHSLHVDDSLLALNVRLRGDEDLRTVLDRSAEIFALWHGLEDVWFGDLYVGVAWQQNSNPAGSDGNDFYEWQDSYYFRVNWRTALRTR